MRIAAYAPLKSPDHPVPSGDRRVARLIDQALRLSGHEVEWPSRLRSRDGAGHPDRQLRLAQIGAWIAARLVRRFEARPEAERPKLWLTYHLYYKAPDLIGPAVAKAMGIPYVVVEASVAAKRADGPWDSAHRAVLAALAQAGGVIALNPADVAGVAPHLAPGTPSILLPPFLDERPYAAARGLHDLHRDTWGRRLKVDPWKPWLVAVAMQRPGDKLRSYETLAAALAKVVDLPWQLLLVGDGPARADVERAFAPLAERTKFVGRLEEADLVALLAAGDLFVWPAINEAYGMALLEAHASGLPAVAGFSPGVASIVADGKTGRLVPIGDADAFAHAVRASLADMPALAAMGEAAAAKIAAAHGLARAAAEIGTLVAQARPR
jgi:glycosyltransferase involved in cell wall biosynthesis